MRFALLPLAAILFAGCVASAQLIPLPPDQLPGNQPPPAAAKPAITPISIATVATQGVSLSGSLSVANGRATIGNDGAITAGDSTADVTLTRGGHLKVCASTKIQLSTDNTIQAGAGALMIALDRGALEAHYTPGRYSDVLLTPDLRILISGPGQADLSLRVNNQGDTCIDNHGDHAPYVLASSLFEGGAYRVQPNQRVLFEHGSLSQVVDNEQEPCGCPPSSSSQPLSLADSGVTGAHPAAPAQKVAANPTAAPNPFPLAESEGLQQPPPPPTKPVVPTGETHVEVSAALAYDARHPDALSALPASAETSAAPASTPASTPTPLPTSAIHVAEAPPAPPAKPKRHTGLFGHLGHFFKRLFAG